MHQSYCMNCFSLMPVDQTVCPACGQDAAALSSRDYRAKLVRALYHPLADVRSRAGIALGLRRDEDAAEDLVQCALRHPKDVTAGLEVLKSLLMMPAQPQREKALRTLGLAHPADAEQRAVAISPCRWL